MGDQYIQKMIDILTEAFNQITELDKEARGYRYAEGYFQPVSPETLTKYVQSKDFHLDELQRTISKRIEELAYLILKHEKYVENKTDS
ncbi:hypothetical protein [Paenibacillus taichungensis]|uniref:Uncharacterized protein n=1 Tax=Paenibacillus taichungensis TaxID=484184 RepID=A0A329QPS0_9BACL|nr:hypothetical protein [Paenibacillus taichungensis]RAW13719.1 hypothetical protein DC345_18190 [Paenibacillus taichungensis]